MAPTVCLAELPMVGNTVSPYFRRRLRIQNSINAKRQILKIGQMLKGANEAFPASQGNPLRELEYANIANIRKYIANYFTLDKSKEYPANTDEHCKELLSKKTTVRKDLLNIILRTVILVRRNHILQKRVNALQAETWRLLNSVLNNPEDNRQQQRTQISQSEDKVVLSSMEKIIVTSSVTLESDLTNNSLHKATFTCNNHNHDNDEQSPGKPENLSKSG